MDKRYIVGFTALVAAMALGIALWLSPWDSPGVTAQEVVETACDKTASALEFDMIVSLDLPGNYAHPLDNERDVWEMKASISGADYHQTLHLTEIPIFGEAIYVDGAAYLREGERQGEGAWAVVDVKGLINPSNWLGYDPSGEETTRVGGENPLCPVPCALCPVLKNLTKAGDETIGGARTTRYTATETIDALWDQPDETLKIFNTFDYWIDAGDQLVQMRLVSVHPAEQHARGQEPTGELERAEIVTKVTGVGEANTITAPNVGQ